MFNVYKKPGELVKYLNTNSHHQHHKTAVLSGVELRLALLTTTTPTNVNLSLSDIYPDKHEALQTAGKICAGEKMRTIQAVIDEESRSRQERDKKKSPKMDTQDSLFNVKYMNFGNNHRPIQQVIKRLRNSYNLKWLQLHVIHQNSQNS
jgi:hypothetical protein